jgi:hypothetical protein
MEKGAWAGKSRGAVAFALTFLQLFLSRKKVEPHFSSHSLYLETKE